MGHDGAGGDLRGTAHGGTLGSGNAGAPGASAAGGMGGVAFVSAPGSHCSTGNLAYLGDTSLNTLDCGGVRHRVASNACPPHTPSDRVLPASGLHDACLSDGDCTATASGSCENLSGNGGRGGNVCHYACATDGDCPGGSICDCLGGRCLTATCATDTSCAPGKLCRQTLNGYGANGFGIHVFRCQTPDDTCGSTSSDCPLGNDCRWAGDRFACLSNLPIP